MAMAHTTTDARSLMERARDGAFNKLDAQRERAASGLGSMVDALRESSRNLEGQNATMASYVDGAASQLERFTGGIRERDLNQMVRDVEMFARERPAIFLGSAFALGLAMARFLKSSESGALGGSQATRYSTRGTDYSTRGTGYSTRAGSPAWPTEPVAGRAGNLESSDIASGTGSSATSSPSEWRSTTPGTSTSRR
jgi:hypothetical protein